MMETLPSGTILHGRYRVERALGSGGFGHVYLAVDLKTNQQFAIKEYLVAGSSGQAQLEHEARVLSRLHHPNLPVFQEAFHERGRYYVVLSYIEGNDLTDYIRIALQRNETIPLARIMAWMLSICDAVIFLHNQQPYVIHRDIKPDNIRITPNATAILVDMGNAKATADGARTLFFIRHQGTPGYAPPEQYPGGSGTDVRSDVYALGGTLYFALTTHEPPSVSTRNQSLQLGQPDLPSLQELLAKNPPEESAEGKAARQFRLGVSKPARPAPRHLRHLAQLGQLSPELLDQLNLIIKRAMAMRPKERYQSVAELSHDLRGIMSALPTQQTQAKPAPPANPYSTEPELPLLQGSMQAAKENKEQQQASPGPQTGPSQAPLPSKDASASPAAQPSPTPVAPSSTRCPRCNTTLAPQAAFCPNCGLPLTNTPRTNTATRSPADPTNNPSPQNKAPEHDISRDVTMVIIPPPQAQATASGPRTGTAVSPKPIPRLFLSPSAPSVSRPTPFLQNNPAVGPSSSAWGAGNERPTNLSRRSSTPATGSRVQPRTIIIAIVIFVVLLIALIVILFTATRPRQQIPTGSRHGPGYYSVISLKTEAMGTITLVESTSKRVR